LKYNDDIAFAVLAALSDLKLAVPADVAVIGYDTTMIADLSIPPLTTIGLEGTDLADRLVESVLSVCRGGPVLEVGTLQAKLVVRESA
jgi:DNA-binding LacI/PurR family transcriptional regulator